MKTLILALCATGFVAVGFQPTLAANPKSRDIEITMGESGKAPPNPNAGSSNGTKTDSSNKGNPDNTNCNDCGTSGPGNK
jgi:hypothetical protein